MLSSIFAIIVVLAILALAYFVCIWAIGALGLPEPFPKIATVILVLAVLGVVLLWVIPHLLSLFGVSLG